MTSSHLHPRTEQARQRAASLERDDRLDDAEAALRAVGMDLGDAMWMVDLYAERTRRLRAAGRLSEAREAFTRGEGWAQSIAGGATAGGEATERMSLGADCRATLVAALGVDPSEELRREARRRGRPDFPRHPSGTHRVEMLSYLGAWSAVLVSGRAAWRSLQKLKGRSTDGAAALERPILAAIDNAVGASLTPAVPVDLRLSAGLDSLRPSATAEGKALIDRISVMLILARSAERRTTTPRDDGRAMQALLALVPSWCERSDAEGWAAIDDDLRLLGEACAEGHSGADDRPPSRLLPPLEA